MISIDEYFELKMVDKNLNANLFTNFLILNKNNDNSKLIKNKNEEIIYKIDWFENRKIISLIKHFTYILQSSPFIEFNNEMIEYLNNKKEEIINLLTSLQLKIDSDKFIDQNELKFELKLSTRLKLINTIINNFTYFTNKKVYTEKIRLNLINENNQLAFELSKLKVINLRELQQNEQETNKGMLIIILIFINKLINFNNFNVNF